MKQNTVFTHISTRWFFRCCLAASCLAFSPLIVLAQNNPLSRQVTIPQIRSSFENNRAGQGDSSVLRINTTQNRGLQNHDIRPLSAELSHLDPAPFQQNRPSLLNITAPVEPVGSYYLPSSEPSVISEPNPNDNQSGLSSISSATPTTSAPVRQLSSADQAAIERIIAQGSVLEKEGRWNEALTLYESAIRAFRKPPVLMQRFRFARFHHDLTRRYNDLSFDMLLRDMAYTETLALYDEVITKIQTSHVDPPHWNELFENGMHDFEIALADPTFCRRHLSNVDAIKTRSLSQKIAQAAENWEIRDPQTLRGAVIAIADACQKEIELNPNAVILEFLAGITNSLDPYTEFMTLNQYNDTNCMISGNFVGLGVELKVDRTSLYINRVILNSPAEKNGLKNFDRILYVDGTATEGLPLETASNLLQGKADSSVHLVVQSGTEPPREATIRREPLKVPSVENVHILNEYGQGANIGYFKLTCFQRNTVQEIVEALHYLYRQGMQSLIIDLRGNAGGVLTESIGAADLFLRQGVIVRTKHRGAVPEYRYSATQKSFTWDIPLVVLIDKDSASASEIFAGAIQDNRRGLIVGQPSFGKDTVQAVIPLMGSNPQNNTPIAGLKLTTETYYSPNGTSFSGVGVQPDILASNTLQHTVARPATIGGGMTQPNSQSQLQSDQVLQTAVDEIRRIFQSNDAQTLSTRYQPSVN